MSQNKTVALHDMQLIDESFEPSREGNYHLSLQLSSLGISACVLDLLTKKYIAFCHYNNNQHDLKAVLLGLANKMNNDSLLSLNYKSKSCAIVHDKATLIPDDLYHESNAASFLQFNVSLTSNKILERDQAIAGNVSSEIECKFDQISNLGAHNVYEFSNELKELLNHQFGRIEVVHYSSILMETLLLENKHKASQTLFVNFQTSDFDLLLIDGNALKLYNSFTCNTKEDFVYYVLFACEQLKLNPEEIKMVLFGELHLNNDYYKLLFKYVRNIQFGKRNQNFHYSYKLNELPTHYFYNLFSQFQCV